MRAIFTYIFILMTTVAVAQRSVLDDSKFNVFPNPATDAVNIQFNGEFEEDFYLNVINEDGTAIRTLLMRDQSTSLNIDDSYKGVLFIEIANVKRDSIYSEVHPVIVK